MITIGNATIHNMDCMDYMKSLPDNSVDLIITSPPYNLGNSHHTGNKRHNPYEDNMPEKKYQEWQINVLNECYRLLNENGSIFYNHKNRIKDGCQITPYEWILKSKLIVKQELVWFNGSQNFDKIRFYPMTERIYWMTKNKETKLFNEINHHDLFYKDEWQSEGTNKFHTRAFPVKMVESLILCFKDAKIIFDPFSGSGTTAIASENLKRTFIGCELNGDYFEQSIERIKLEAAQERLF
jgi:site-specific DNA-methyltransferase (adenine-specific)